MGGEVQFEHPFSLPSPPLPPPPPPSSSGDDPDVPALSLREDSPSRTPPAFDPSRMIGIIKRKALIKDLAALYHAECLTYCQQLLELQKKVDEPFVDNKAPENSRKETARPTKRSKKAR